MKKEERPIKSAHDAVKYAMRTAVNPKDWPRFIVVDEEQRPLERNTGDWSGLIVVTRRAGDPTPTELDTMLVKATKATCDSVKRDLIDFIIIGTDGFYSFAAERVLSRPLLCRDKS